MSATCFHCGEPCQHHSPEGMIDGQQYSFCCHGCKTLAQWIDGQGWSQLYQTRTAYQPSADSSQHANLRWYQQQFAESEYTTVIAADSSPELRRVELLIDGLNCAACVWLCEQSLQRLEGVVEVSIRFEAGRLSLSYDQNQTTLADICQLIEGFGYQLKPYEAQAQEQQFQAQQHRYLSRLGVSGLTMMLIASIALAMHFGASHGMAVNLGNYLQIISTVVSAIILLYSAWPFLAGAAISLRQRVVSMDVTVALAVVLAWCLSAYNVFSAATSGQMDYRHITTYNESLLMLVFFILVSRYTELRVRHKNLQDIARLHSTVAIEATVIRGETRQQVPVKSLHCGDVLQLKRGDTIPCDVRLQSAATEVDESVLTGEFIPVHKAQGELLLAGSINVGQPVYAVVERTGADTYLSAVQLMAEQAQQQKAKISSLADQTANSFLVLVLVIAVSAGWAWFHINPDRVVYVVLSVLIAACPCALSIATPAALSRAMLALRQRGVMLKSPDTLFALSTIKRLVFDKTGTLTTLNSQQLEVQLQAEDWSQQQALQLAAAMQAISEHSLAEAFKPYYASKIYLASCEIISGKGLYACHQGQSYRLGSAAFIQEWHPNYQQQASLNGMVVVLASQAAVIAEFIVQESLRPHAATTIEALQQRFGWPVAVVSGDIKARVEAVTSAIKAKLDIYGAQTIEQKLQRLQQWQQQQPCLWLGDGINDAPAMSAAAVSIAMPNAVDLATHQADVVLLKPQLNRLTLLIDIAEKTRRIVKQGFYWSIAYNLFALLLAACGLLSPLVAVLGMVFSSLLVMLNSQRVGRVIAPQALPRLVQGQYQAAGFSV